MTADFYPLRSAHFQAQVNQHERTIRQFAWARVVSALGGVSLLYFGFQNPAFFFAASFFGIAFVYLVQQQLKRKKECAILSSLVKLNQQEAHAAQFDFSGFGAGEEFMDPTHPFTHDLDIFGKGSVFQYINRCATQLGEKKLADNLSELKTTEQTILAKQEAVRELSSLLDFRQRCWAIGKQLSSHENELQSLYQWLKEPDLLLQNKFIQLLKWLLPVITGLSAVGIFFNPIFQSVFFLLFNAQIVIAGLYGKAIGRLQHKLSAYRDVLKNYAQLFQEMEKQSPTSAWLVEHAHISRGAAKEVQRFSLLVNSLETRLNVFARIAGNGLFLYDFHSVTKLEVWRKNHAPQLPLWMESLAEWDSLLSFATLRYNQPLFCFADFQNRLEIQASDLGHLLIPSTMRVTNSVNLGNPCNLLLITGANMAGKSTFLRALGVNYVLALNGSPVCATTWICPLANLRTGMRATDSLQENKSYFFAELNRLQSIMEELKKGQPSIILLDEILKGTNSTDKQTGSRELIRQLIQQRALTVIATHDIALGDMAEQYPNHISNACFEGEIKNDALSFDYKMHSGVAQKANATFLMRKMGIIPN
jgi:DNA mismatch repair ATPase MutS